MRPHVTVNFAMSADGKISTRERRQVKISGTTDFERVDRMRAGCDAIMVGIGTVLSDDPSLTVKSGELRAWRTSRGLPENPVRVIVDSRGRTPPDASVLLKGPGKRVVACAREADPGRLRSLQPLAVIVVAGEVQVDLGGLLEILSEMGVRELMVEGGGNLLFSMFGLGLVDEMYQFIGNIIIGGSGAPTPAEGQGYVRENEFPRMDLVEYQSLDEGILLHWKFRKTA